MSDEEKVRSGVPKGTSLASVLFTILISDIDKEVKQNIQKCFVDD